jgi:hypothetical protein
MVSGANNNEFFFPALKVASIRMHTPFKNELGIFLSEIKNDLFVGKAPVKEIIIKKLPAIFNLRLKALKWHNEEGATLIELLTNEVYSYFEQMRQVKRMSMLASHVINALDWNKKIVASLKSVKEVDISDFHSFDIPDISFDLFLNAIYLSNPNQDEVKTMIDWAKCSLFIEYIALAAFIINDEKLLVDENKIVELSGTLSEVVQAYISLAGDLHLIPANEDVPLKRKNDSKGAAIFQKMLNDKKLIQGHLANGGELSDLKENFNFVNPLLFTTK